MKKTCYYELLGIDKKATTSQIKTNYRKMALKYHPDKNSSEQAKQIFVQITEAYNVLSDPNERTWYDNNRQKILFNKEQMSKEDLEEYSFGFNIWNYFTASCFKGYGDQEGGFYEVYRNVIQKIKAQQMKAFAMRDDLEEDQRKYEGFGDSNTVQEKILRFYDDWENFTTYKTFVWAEDYDTRDASNRYIKRQMAKENKKQRLKEKKNYIKTIKDLISFLKKRDPRYRDYLLQQKEEEQKRQREKKIKEQQKKKAKEQMKKAKEQMEAQRYKEIEQYYKEQNIQFTKEQDQYEEQDDLTPQYYCQVCEKEFKSQNQLRNHEKSKMHKLALKQLQKQVMLKEEFVQEAKKQAQKVEVIEEPKKKNKRKRKKKNQQNVNEDNSEEQEPKKVEKQKKEEPEKKQEIPKEDSDDSEDDTDAFMTAMLGKQKNVQKQPQQKMTKNMKKEIKKVIESESQSEEEGKNQKKMGKAKQKREKKANQQKQSQFKCNVCSQPFPSKTKLFEHIKKLNHMKAK